MDLGRTLDVGCGVGRNLENLDGSGVGVDHNADAVASCRARGFVAYTTEEFAASEDAATEFDALLFAHVLEHMPSAEATALGSFVSAVRPSARQGGVHHAAGARLPVRLDARRSSWISMRSSAIASECDLSVVRRRSFPFPRPVGRVFTYNEFVVVATAT